MIVRAEGKASILLSKAEFNMLNCGGAATHMQNILSDYEFVVTNSTSFEDISRAAVRPPFDPLVIALLDAWSAQILAVPDARSQSALVTFAFWCRKNNLEVLRKRWMQGLSGRELLLGRGLVFHVASTNMPLNVGYTLAIALLSGNSSIVKLALRRFVQTETLLETLAHVLQEERFAPLASHVCIVRYDIAQTTLTDRLSALCDVRMVWGGDDTIGQIRLSPLRAHAFDICFSERYSLCIINCDGMEADGDMEDLAQDFYNDAYVFDQNAFTAPHLVVWLGQDEIKRMAIKEKFWEAVLHHVQQRYTVDASLAADKLTILCREAADRGQVQREHVYDNRLVRIRLKHLDDAVYAYKGLGGLFHEYDATSLQALASFIDSRVQTVAYHALEADTIKQFIRDNHLRGVDRLVSIGRTADFDIVWDGFDLIQMLTRIVV